MKKLTAFLFSSAILFLFVLVSPSSAQAGCNSNTDPTSCNAACVNGYFCSWKSATGTCSQTAQSCGGAPSTTGVCPGGTSPSGCLDHQNTATGQWYCDCYVDTSSNKSCSSSGYALCNGTTTVCNGTYACGGTTSTPPTPTPTATPTTRIPNPILNPVAPIACMTGNPMPVTFTWSAVTGASSYYLRIDDTSNPWLAVCNTSTPPNPGDICSGFITGTSFTALLIPGKTYNYWISTFTNNNTTSSSGTPPLSLTIPNIPCAPTQTGPTGTIACQSGSYSTVNFNWSSVAGASSYYLRIDDKSNGWVTCPAPGTTGPTPMPGDSCISGIATNSYSVKLQPNKTYDWWVSGYNGSTPGVLSPPMTFTVPPVCTPTPAPITAKCVSTTIYSPNWTPILSNEYTSLPDNSQVYFCSAGSSSGGSFDMARFTINGVLFPNTTLMRPGSSDYCQLFTIPAGLYTTTVQGEMHHTTLGWL